MTTPHPDRTTSRRATVAGLSAGVLGLALAGRGSPAQAQAATPGPLPAIVGAWQWNADPARPEPSTFGIFHADGTYVEWQPVGGAAIGIWRSTGEFSYDLLFIFPDTDPSLDGFAPGTATFTLTVELDRSGDALVAAGTVDVRDVGGAPLATVPWQRPAARLTFTANPALGSIPATPMAGTPTS